MTFTDEGKMMDDYRFKLGLAIAREEELKKKLDALIAYDEAKEREMFEVFAMTRGWDQPYFKLREDGNYEAWAINPEWRAWKACAKSRARSAE